MNELVVSVGAPSKVSLTPSAAVSVAFAEYVPMRPADADWYEGPYSVTPTGTAQVLPTDGLLMADDVTVAPIPSNYGRISYQGNVLTVS